MGTGIAQIGRAIGVELFETNILKFWSGELHSVQEKPRGGRNVAAAMPGGVSGHEVGVGNERATVWIHI